MEQIRILIVEDEPIIARDIASTLEHIDYAIAGICFTYEEAKDFLENKTADFVLLDINLGQGTEGITLGTYIDENLHLPFLYLTSYSDKDTLNKAKFTFPMAYLLKPFEEKDLLVNIELALFNHSRIHNRIHFNQTRINQKLLSPITDKEYEVLLDIYAGLTNQQLCDKHYISMNTVKTHVKRIFDKFDVKSRTELIVKLRNWH